MFWMNSMYLSRACRGERERERRRVRNGGRKKWEGGREGGVGWQRVRNQGMEEGREGGLMEWGTILLNVRLTAAVARQ